MLLLAWDLRFLRIWDGKAMELVPLRFGFSSSSSDALGSMIGKTQLAKVMERIAKKVKAAMKDAMSGNRMASPLT